MPHYAINMKVWIFIPFNDPLENKPMAQAISKTAAERLITCLDQATFKCKAKVFYFISWNGTTVRRMAIFGSAFFFLLLRLFVYYVMTSPAAILIILDIVGQFKGERLCD